MGSRDLTWRRLAVLVRQSPKDSALVASVGGPSQWGWVEHLLAGVLHSVQAGNWQRGGGKGSKPKAPKPPGKDGRRRFGGSSQTPEEMRRILDEWSTPGLLGPDGNPMKEVTDGD